MTVVRQCWLQCFSFAGEVRFCASATYYPASRNIAICDTFLFCILITQPILLPQWTLKNISYDFICGESSGQIPKAFSKWSSFLNKIIERTSYVKLGWRLGILWPWSQYNHGNHFSSPLYIYTAACMTRKPPLVQVIDPNWKQWH